MKRREKLLLLLLLIFILFLILLHRAVLFYGNGSLFYLYDDAYIHMAIAKNLVKHGVFGITKFSYTPASSSPLWTYILSFFYLIFGPNTWLPFVLNLIFFLILIFSLWKELSYLSGGWAFLLSSLFIIFLPGYFVIYSGMEHTLHILLVFLLTREILQYFQGKGPSWYLYVLIALSMGTRYETMFIVFILMGIMLLKKDLTSAMLSFSAMLPIPTLQGMLNIKNGWGFFPASVAVKGNSAMLKYLIKGNIIGAWSSFASDFKAKFHAFFSSPTLSLEIFIFFLWSFLILSFFVTEREKSNWVFYVFPPALVLFNFLFSVFSYPPRYQNYLFPVFFLVTLWYFKEKKFHSPGIYVLSLSFLIFFLPRAVLNYKVPIGSYCIYSQQYQMAMFLKRFYPKGTVVLNDIGTVSYYNDSLKIIDYVGLSNKTFYKLRTEPVSLKEKIIRLKQALEKTDADLAIVFPKWIESILPDNWKEVGRWLILKNLVLPNVEVVFYRIKDPDLAKKLRFNSVYLPDVAERGEYTKEKGFISWNNKFLFEPNRVILLGPYTYININPPFMAGKYHILIRARGLGGTIRVAGREIEITKASFYPYTMKFTWQHGASLKIENPSPFTIGFKEILFFKSP